jgi:hypothetical protein
MALVFLEGFDKHGGINAIDANVVALLTAGEWTSTAGSAHQIAAPLSSTGFALQLGNGTSLTKTLAANYSRLIGGVRFSAALTTTNGGLSFLDAGTAQASVTVNSTGTFSVRAGGVAGTALGTSSATVTANTTHYLEWDITFANAGSFQLWLDGVSILSGSGDTTGTANNFANQLQLVLPSGTNTIIYDDLYLLDTTGSTNNAVLLTSPRIETQFPSSDGAVQFAVGAAVLGSTLSRAAVTGNALANTMYLRPVIPTVNCTISAIGFQVGGTGNASINLRPVIYSNSGGAPATLLSAGSTVTGATAGAYITLPLTTPQSLTAGTTYWVGLMVDIAQTNFLSGTDANNSGVRATSTFASGAPGTAPAMTTGQPSWLFFGVVSGAGNFYSVSQNPPQGSYSYVYDATVGHEDLFGFPALTTTPSAIYAVAMKGHIAKSDAGAKTASLRVKSGATDSAGSAASLAPGTTYGWLTSLFTTDPATGAAWTAAALNAAQSGVKVES